MVTEQPIEPVNEFGEKIFGTKYTIWYKDDPDDKDLKKIQVRANSISKAASKAASQGPGKFVYRVELVEGSFKIAESNLPNGIKITPIATQRKWEDLKDKALKKWSWAEDKLDSMWYNHDLFIGVDKYKDGTLDLIYGYPITNSPSYAVKITAHDFEGILKDPVRWLIERFGIEKAHSYLQRVKSKSFWENGAIRKIFSPVKVEVAEAHGVDLMKEATYSFTKIKKDPESWYNEPQMRGHTWAKEMLDMVERIVNKNSGTDWQRYIIDNVFDFNISGKDTWHYFITHVITKKYLAHTQFVLRNGGKMSALQLLWWRSRKSGYLKDDLDWALEYAAYKHDPEKYTEWYSKSMGFYGLPKDEAAHRLKNYITNKIAPKIKSPNLA